MKRARGIGKSIRVGVVGVGRGQSFMTKAGESAGMKLVAICDTWESRLKKVGETYKVTTYTDFNKFLEHDMEAVILANYFHEHAPFAIRALAAGKHVMSETMANGTIADGVALCRAVEKSGLTYMFAENYPYIAANQEMRRLYRAGEIGDATYAEGEYNHPMSPRDLMRISPGVNHWRNWIPPTYYCTHALAPLMYITGGVPVSVNALSIACPYADEATARRGDPGAVILCRTDSGAVFRLFGLALPGHTTWYRIQGSHGAMEITRGGLEKLASRQVRVWHDEWDTPKGTPRERTYVPDWPEHGDLARQAGHGGGDFWTNFHFAEAIRTGKPPFLDVYRGVNMSSVGIMAWKSAMQDGAPIAMPDFRRESSRKRYENDRWSPWPEHAGPGQPAPSIHGIRKPTRTGLAFARKVWKEIAYEGD